MEYKSKPNVICLGDPKQSALYFDRVAPISFVVLNHKMLSDKNSSERDLFDRVVKDLTGNPAFDTRGLDDILAGFLESIRHLESHVKTLFEYYSKNDFIPDIDETKDDPLLQVAKKFIKSKMDKEGKLPENAIKRYAKPDPATVEPEVREILASAYADDVPIVKGENAFKPFVEDLAGFEKVERVPVSLPAACLRPYEANDDDLTVSLVNLPLVDTEKATWDQILEFRKNHDARRKLRNFRLFFHENYDGKNKAYIEDHLNKRLDDYENTRNDLGFETRESTFSAILSSKNLIKVGTATLLAAILGGPIAVGATIATGAVLEAGKISLTIAKRQHAFHKLQRDHDLAYIIQARQTLDATS